MAASKLILTALRCFQLLCAAVVLGTSVSLHKFLPKYQDFCNSIEQDSLCDFKGLIPAVGFGICVGALGLLDAIVGLVATWMEVVPALIMAALDGLAALVYLASGLATSIILSKSVFDQSSGSRFTECKADAAFQIIGFLVTIVLIGFTFLWRRSGKMSSAV